MIYPNFRAIVNNPDPWCKPYFREYIKRNILVVVEIYKKRAHLFWLKSQGKS